MHNSELKQKLEEAQNLIAVLEQELNETNYELISLTVELERARENYKTIFENALEGIFRISSDGKRFTMANPALAEILGYDSREDLIASVKNIPREIYVDYKQYTRFLKRVKKKEDITQAEVQVYTKDKKRIWVLLNYYAIRETGTGRQSYYEGTMIDIDERKEYEDQLKESMKEKKSMLDEIHHRVKNNLAVISGLLELEAANIESEDVKKILYNSKSRIHSMAKVHEKLYQSKNFSSIELGECVNEISALIARTVTTTATDIKMDIRADKIFLNINQAVPCVLILNELIANAYKHAFEGRSTGKITVELKQYCSTIELIVADNGIGIPADFDLNSSKSLGMRLVRTLTKQLHADIHIDNEKNTRFRITFIKPERSADGHLKHMAL